MYLEQGITGRSLAEGSLALTFDDGPGITDPGGSGPRTLELAEYLSDQEVPATFFVVGKHVEQYPDVVGRLKALGHLVGNHTYHHPNLVHLASHDGDIHAEVAMTAAILGHDSAPTVMRPPYGAWSPDLAQRLNDRPLGAARTVGPVMWDIDGRDWECWSAGMTPDAAATRYVEEVESAGRGIVLMHDSTADGRWMRSRNRTFEMVRELLPRLRDRGYDFVPLDAVPEVAGAVGRGVQVALTPPFDGLRVELREGDQALLRVGDDEFLVVDQASGGLVRHRGPAVHEDATFDVLPVGRRAVAFRTSTGRYLGCSADETALTADATAIGRDQVFACSLPSDGRSH